MWDSNETSLSKALAGLLPAGHALDAALAHRTFTYDTET
jgi:hypothetical protein